MIRSGTNRGRADRLPGAGRALTLVGPTSEAEAASNSVGCFKQAFPAPGEKPAFRKKPSKCVYIDKGALSLPVPPTSAVQTTKDVRWRSGGGRTAKGRGMGFSGTREFRSRSGSHCPGR